MPVQRPPQEPEKIHETARVEGRSLSIWKGIGAALSHPIGLAILSFLLTGVAATVFSKWLDDLSKARELELAARQRGVESVRVVTDLLYERRIRAVLVASSISRNAPLEELKERKKAYDDSFIKWNATLKSNMLRVREMFHATDYSIFESLLEDDVGPLFTLQDDCLTTAYDIAISNNNNYRPAGRKETVDCLMGSQPSVAIRRINSVILDCIFSYTDALYRATQNVSLSRDETEGDIQKIKKFCGNDRLFQADYSPVH